MEVSGRSIWLNEKVFSNIRFSLKIIILKIDYIPIQNEILSTISFKLEIGTRILLPGFESTFAFRNFMTLLAKRFAGSDASRKIQMQIESEIPPQNGGDLPLTQLDRLDYFKTNFRSVHFFDFCVNIHQLHLPIFVIKNF